MGKGINALNAWAKYARKGLGIGGQKRRSRHIKAQMKFYSSKPPSKWRNF